MERVGYNDIKRWMCLVYWKEEITVEFFDQLHEARTFQMNCICGMGCRCHIYEYIDGHYEFRED